MYTFLMICMDTLVLHNVIMFDKIQPSLPDAWIQELIFSSKLLKSSKLFSVICSSDTFFISTNGAGRNVLKVDNNMIVKLYKLF